MSLKITCTACGENWKPSKPVAPGKRVRCPECAEIFVVGAEEADSELPSRRARAAAEPPRRRKTVAADRPDDNEAAPRRRRPRDRDDDDDDRPRRGGKGRTSKRGLVIGLVAGGTGLVVMAAVVAGIMIMNSGARSPAKTNTTAAPTNLPGHEYRSETGKYKITFPGVPQEKTENASGVLFRSATLEVRDGAYVAGYGDMPVLANATPEMIQKGLLGGQDGALRNANATVTSQNAITLDGKYPGREFTGKLNGPQQGEIRAKLYVVGSRFYQIFVVGQGALAHSSDADRFLSSFTVDAAAATVDTPQPTGEKPVGPGPRGKKKK